MEHKNLIATIFLKDGKAVKGKHDPESAGDLKELAKVYNDSGVDKLYIFDLSDSDKEHETNLHTIKELSRIMEIPIYGAGSIARLEDIKKLLYAGCAKAALNYYNIGMSLEGCSKELLQEMRFNEIAAYEQCGEWENAKAKAGFYGKCRFDF